MKPPLPRPRPPARDSAAADIFATRARTPRRAGEFALRAQVFSPSEILRQVTSLNAELLQMSDRIGRVAPGYAADLIAVEGDPLEDIACLGRGGANVPVILQGGKFHKREGV